MKSEHYRNLPVWAALFTVIFKLLFLYTHHIQEDAFITWRVAQNLLDYDVIGFNGATKISASTTHLYVFVSWFFNLIFGKEHFIYPLLIFNSALFTIGTYWLSKLILKGSSLQAWFIILFGLLPPSVKISILGMEYGILFFLYMALLYFGFSKNRIWAQILFPVLILFTRIDTVIFLGVLFVADLLQRWAIRWMYILGGVLGVLVVIGFNELYFHELVNNTIIAKSVAYEDHFTLSQKIEFFFTNAGNFWGMLKLPGNINPFTMLILIFEICCLVAILRKKEERNFYIVFLFAYGWIKQIIFLSQRSYFDWYYWIPQILLFIPVLVVVLEQKQKKYLWRMLLILFYILPMLLFQTVHSIATGNGEWNYRRTIGLFLQQYEKDKNQWIFLEPAGYVPYFSGLKTMDEVGLVDKGVQTEILKNRAHYKLNIVKNRKPKYLLSYQDLFQGKDEAYYRTHYRLIKEFRIQNHLNSNSPVLNRIYHLKPSGSDYNLYERVK